MKKNWGREHYTQRAKREGYAARSVYKLEWLNKRHTLLRKGMRVLDLGCAPGAWTQYIHQMIGAQGLVVGVDLQAPPLKWGRYPYWQLNVLEAPLAEVCAVLLGKAGKAEKPLLVKMGSSSSAPSHLGLAEPTKMTLDEPLHWQAQLAGPFDLLCSDMAPKTTGTPAADAARSHQLVLAALAWAKVLLKPNGILVAKVFQGAGIETVRQAIKPCFGKLYTQRPPATRSASVETFFVGVSA